VRKRRYAPRGTHRHDKKRLSAPAEQDLGSGPRKCTLWLRIPGEDRSVCTDNQKFLAAVGYHKINVARTNATVVRDEVRRSATVRILGVRPGEGNLLGDLSVNAERLTTGNIPAVIQN